MIVEPGLLKNEKLFSDQHKSVRTRISNSIGVCLNLVVEFTPTRPRLMVSSCKFQLRKIKFREL
jgi:hypothetical protein